MDCAKAHLSCNNFSKSISLVIKVIIILMHWYCISIGGLGCWSVLESTEIVYAKQASCLRTAFTLL